MKTCFLLLTVVPCLAFHQAAAPSTRRRNNADLIARSASATIQDEKATTTVDLPPVLQDIVDERAEFQRNLGKAMDTLRKDYPYILHRAPGTNLFVNLMERTITLSSLNPRSFTLQTILFITMKLPYGIPLACNLSACPRTRSRFSLCKR